MSPLSTQQILSGPALREFIMLAGKDSVGKTCAVLSLAWYIEQTQPSAKFYLMDTENKVKAALRSFGPDAPNNIVYYKCDNMNHVTQYADEILTRHKPGDWVAVESMSRVWERAQDLGYQAVTGMGKADYMEKRRAAGKAGPVTPRPDDLWSIVKGAHDGAFLDLLSQSDDINVVLTTTLAKVKPDSGFMKENADRKAARVELGMDAGIEGAPRLPYYVETLCLLKLKDGHVSCQVLRDNLSALEDSRTEFDGFGRKEWASTFWSLCR